MTIDAEREKVWSRRFRFKERSIPERRLPVAMLKPQKPPDCQVCGWPVAARPTGGEPFCPRCEHRLFHARGCGCRFDPARPSPGP